MKNTDPPTIPMQVQHQRLILTGDKTSTLRQERWDPGDYIMVGTNGDSLGSLRITEVGEQPVSWNKLTPQQQQSLAESEGYDNKAIFMTAARRLRYSKFIDGQRAMYVHTIEPVLEEPMPRKKKRSDLRASRNRRRTHRTDWRAGRAARRSIYAAAARRRMHGDISGSRRCPGGQLHIGGTGATQR